ncbi:MAG: PQQ-binding-like beta-propeller repeat protein, partial [Myxococcales bacterium]|nr:PQQ-binding-like beta-propeller repeat protein [Myxococcales bacterium]
IDSAGTLYALDADGTTLFSKSLGGAVTRIPPVVTSTQILALTDSGTLVAYDHGGTKKLDQPAGGTPIGPPVVGADGTIYVSSITELRALKPDGSTRWSVGRTAHGSVAIDPQSGTIYAVLDSDLYSVDPQTGQETLRFTIPGTAGDFTPLLAGDLIHVVDGTKLLAINKTSWQLDGSYSASEGLLDCIRFPKQTGRIYVHGEHVMVGLNADLSEAWKLTGLDINGSCAAFGDAPNRLYVGTLQKQLYAINLLAAP